MTFMSSRTSEGNVPIEGAMSIVNLECNIAYLPVASLKILYLSSAADPIDAMRDVLKRPVGAQQSR